MNEGVLRQFIRADDMYMPLIALCIFIFMRNKILKRESLLFIYLLINVVFAAVTDFMGYYHINNLALYHFYTLFEQWFISYYIIKKIIEKNSSAFYIIINTAFTFFWLLNIYFFEPLNVFNSNTAVISNLLILLFCMYFMLNLSKSEQILFFQKFPPFWIISGFLVYSALSILIFSIYKYYTIQNLTLEGNEVWSLMHITIVAKFVMISFGLLCYKKSFTSIRSPLLL